MWSNEDGIAPFADAVRRKGAARAAAESRYVAIHVVGETVGGRSKLEWLRLILPELYAGSADPTQNQLNISPHFGALLASRPR